MLFRREHSRGPLARASVGIGWRPELAADLLADPGCADFVEVVAETCFARPAWRREACAIAEIWPVVPHGISLSLGSAEGIDLDRARRLGRLARDLRAPAVSEHVALTHVRGRDIGHLTAVPYSREAVRAVARNVARARRVLPDVPFLLENIAWTLRWPEDEMEEGEFYEAVAAATGCDLLLDLANLRANAINSGRDPLVVLESYPLSRVRMVHIAGGATEHDGFFADTHAHPVPAAVFALLEELVRRTGPVPVLLERDGSFPPFSELAEELARVRAALRHDGVALEPAGPAPLRRAVDPGPGGVGPDGAGGLASRQAALASMLTSAALTDDTAPFEAAAVARTRAVLRRKQMRSQP